MVSRKNEWISLRDDFSVFLSQVRTLMRAEQFRSALRVQRLADHRYEEARLRDGWLDSWILETSTTLGSLNRGLAAGRCRRRDFRRLMHLYRHLLD